MPASEIIYELKESIIYANAEMAKGVTEVIKVLSEALNERQNAADIRRTEMDEHLPFTSILVRKLRTEIEDNKNLAQEASTMTQLLSSLVKQLDNICKDARNLMNSFSLEKKLGVEVKDDVSIQYEEDVVSHKSNVNAFGDNMIDDDEYDVTVREAKRDIVKQDEHMEKSEKTGVLDETALMDTDKGSNQQ
ncbi:unnamed protein product [Onchocerca flexuosa]|uniref:Biogenesis of lysosome-related organelles complex 1 subunit 7 n=1 Tax=Onchocerca flexuosa TaxID=387005 RepID=A0A183I5Z1_9BILA|nr:unnamed protein product [Onchocerca flexuosa]